jgi:hypothetical protein
MAKAGTDAEKVNRALKAAWRAWRQADAASKRCHAAASEARENLKEATIRLHEIVGDATGLPAVDHGPLYDEAADPAAGESEG